MQFSIIKCEVKKSKIVSIFGKKGILTHSLRQPLPKFSVFIFKIVNLSTAIIRAILGVRSMFSIPINFKFIVDYKEIKIFKIYYVKFWVKFVQRECGIGDPEWRVKTSSAVIVLNKNLEIFEIKKSQFSIIKCEVKK